MNEENNVNNTTSDTLNTFNSEYNFENNEKKPNKKITILLISIILGILIFAGVFYYFGVFTRADQLYKRIIGKGITEVSEQLLDTEYKTIDAEMSLDANVDIDDELLTDDVKDILDLINEIKIDLGVKCDKEKAIVDVEADYDKEELIDLQLYADIKNEKGYIHLGKLLDKYIQLEEEDFEFEIPLDGKELELTKGQKASIKKFVKELKKEILKSLKKEYCFNEKEKIEIDGKSVSVTKSTFRIKYSEVMKETTQLFKNIKNNKKMLDCLNESGKEQFIDAIDEMLEEMEDFDYSDYDDMVFEYNIYTKGILMNDIVKFDINIEQENQEMKVFEIEKISDDEWSYNIPVESSVKIYGKIYSNGEENKLNLNVDVEDFGTVTLNLGYSLKFNVEIKSVDVSKAISIDELTQQDQTTLMTNLQNSKLYSIITDLGSGVLGNLNGNNNSFENEEDDESWYESNDINNNENILTGNNENVLIGNNEKIELSTYNGLKARLDIPQGYTLDKEIGSSASKYLEKNGANIWISLSYGKINDLYKSLEQSKKYYLEDDFYKNVKLTGLESKVINNKTFYYNTFEYEYGSYGQKSVNDYIWLQVSDDYTLKIQLTGVENITESEINTILNSIEVGK